MKKIKNIRGFTLIELLVVISIVGILTSVVLVSINSAKDKSIDTAIKATLANATVDAEVFIENNGTFEGVCSASTDRAIGPYVLNAGRKLSPTISVGGDSNQFFYSPTGGSSGTGRSAICHDSPTGWLAIVSLKKPKAASSGWCIDSKRNAREVISVDANVIECPVC